MFPFWSSSARSHIFTRHQTKKLLAERDAGIVNDFIEAENSRNRDRVTEIASLVAHIKDELAHELHERE